MSAVLLLGGRSEIGLAIVEELLRQRGGEVLLAQRGGGPVDEFTSDRLLRAGASGVTGVAFDALQLDQHEELVRRVVSEHDVDRAVVAFGILGDQEEAWTSVAAAQRMMTVNTTAAVGVGVALAGALQERGGGVIVAVSSVAGVRVRRSNFVYGASKSAMDAFYLNLGVALRGTGVRVLVVRPGAVDTRMIHGNDPVALTVEPAEVGRAAVAALAAGRDVVHIPRVFGPAMALAGLLPQALWSRLPV